MGPRFVYALALMLIVLYGCGMDQRIGACQTSTVRDSMSYFLTDIRNCFSRQEYGKALELSYQLRALGDRHGDWKSSLYGKLYIAQSYVVLDRTDSMDIYLNEAYKIAEDRDEWYVLASVCNAKGGNTAFAEGDYSEGIAWFQRGLEFAREAGDTSRIVLLEGNLAMAYCLIGDTMGLRYARNVYDMGVSRNDDYTVFIGAMTCAYLYHAMAETDMAMYYVRRMLPLTPIFDASRETYVLYADILADAGYMEEAGIYYKKALNEQAGPGLFSKADVYLGYAGYLKWREEYGKAIEVLKKGLETLDSSRSPSKRHLIYLALAEVYKEWPMGGDYKTALFYYEKYKNESDRLFNIGKEREVGRITIQYQNQMHESELLEWRNRFNVTLMLSVLSFVTALVFILLYRNRERYSRQLLCRYQAELEKMQNKRKVSVPKDGTSELFDRLGELMRSEKIYRRHDLSRDTVALLLSTNRTYLCGVIKACTGMSFLYYINSFRINEAVTRLSDPADTTPIKALAYEVGFNNIATFYRLFQAAKGMPPSRYRETVSQNANLA